MDTLPFEIYCVHKQQDSPEEIPIEEDWDRHAVNMAILENIMEDYGEKENKKRTANGY